MNRIWKVLVLIPLALLLAGCQPQDSYSGRVIFSGAHRLEAGEVLPGELLVLGGSMDVEPGARITGSVHVLDGWVDLAGEVDGNINLLLGRAVLRETALVSGSIHISGGELEQAGGAAVLGAINRAAAPPPASGAGPAGRLPGLLVELPLLAGLAFLSVRFLPAWVANLDHAGTRYFVVSLSLGVLGWVVGLALLLIMAYTILLLPLTVLGFLGMLMASGYGAVPYMLRLGQWLSLRLHWHSPAPVSAALGAVVLLLLFEVLRLLPVIGGFLPLAVFAAGFGSVLLTRFGLYRFVPPNPDVMEEQVTAA